MSHTLFGLAINYQLFRITPKKQKSRLAVFLQDQYPWSSRIDRLVPL